MVRPALLLLVCPSALDPAIARVDPFSSGLESNHHNCLEYCQDPSFHLKARNEGKALRVRAKASMIFIMGNKNLTFLTLHVPK